ncbi:MAG: hypothetical protein JJU12_08375 [Chlamydiales bacterium]|nr:hypothetical protein [Chlamydiales bacterium]
MFQLIYIEEEIRSHPRVLSLLRRYTRIPQVIIGRYGEVFNRRGQNFRVQKKHPCLILAKKYNGLVLETPPTYGIGTRRNYYFSHLLNCPFDCRYCFLQGMFSSAHYLFFVNYEDFQAAIEEKAGEDATFFTGYDCDSLAFEGVTAFAHSFLPFIEKSPALFEFRTKSTRISPFLERRPLSNVIVAYTLTPHEEHEHRAPPLDSRLESMRKLQEKGWQLGLRFDPMIYEREYETRFSAFFEKVFSTIRPDAIHSVSLGGFRVPPHIHKRMVKLYPKEPLFFREEGRVEEMLSFCAGRIVNYIPNYKFYPCDVKSDSCNRREPGDRGSDKQEAS